MTAHDHLAEVFEDGGLHDVPDLESIDAPIAEGLTAQTRGITGATSLKGQASMSNDDYEYLAEFFIGGGESVDRPSGLWRRRGDEYEYLSLIDWTWHARGDVYLPHPDLLHPISAEQAQKLLADHQRFVKYWVLRRSPSKGDLYDDTIVYRQIPSPESLVEEGFGRANEWVRTQDIRDFEVGGPHDVPDLEPIDAETAERLIQETRGVTGATEL
jgi:hypothetical protein